MTESTLGEEYDVTVMAAQVASTPSSTGSSRPSTADKGKSNATLSKKSARPSISPPPKPSRPSASPVKPKKPQVVVRIKAGVDNADDDNGRSDGAELDNVEAQEQFTRVTYQDKSVDVAREVTGNISENRIAFLDVESNVSLPKLQTPALDASQTPQGESLQRASPVRDHTLSQDFTTKDQSLAPMTPSSERLYPVVVAGSPENKSSIASDKTPKISLKVELFSIIFALVSVALAVSTYSTLSKSATQVEPILRNWQQSPLVDIKFVLSGAACPAGSISDMQTVLKWPGVSSLGCACPVSSQIASSSTECTTDQVSKGCVQDAAISEMPLDAWRGTKICLVRGGQPVIKESADGSLWTRPNPAEAIPHQCPEGYRRCGRTTMDDWRATCTPSNDLCPLTLLASENVFPNYGSASVMKALFEKHKSSRSWLEYKDHSANLYLAESSLVVSQQLPLVDFMVAFMHPEEQLHPYLGPCNEDIELNKNLQTNYGGVGTYASVNASSIEYKYPPMCSENPLDSRWKAFDFQLESDVLMENIWNSPECQGIPKDDQNAALKTNYWVSGIRCSHAPNAPIAVQCSGGITADMTCANNDIICQNSVYQSRCGRVINAFRQSSKQLKVGLFTRNQIFWKESCASDYTEVQENNSPLQRAILAIICLLGLSAGMNFFTILISTIVIFIYEFNVNIPCIRGGVREDANFLKLLTEKIATVVNIIKLVPCIVAVVYLSSVHNFYREVSEAKCSDPTTNMTFDKVGSSVNIAFTLAVLTLAVDILQFAYFYIRRLWRSTTFNCASVQKKVQPVSIPAPILTHTPKKDEEI